MVSRLFYIVKPDRSYFGDKDFQQIAVVKAMVKSLGLGVDIVECPIVRDADGLAMSSRNTLLAADERAIAPHIYKTLSESVAYAKSHSVKETHDFVVAGINSVDGLDHYLRVDMGEGNSVSLFTFTFTTRNTNSEVNSPTTIVVIF